MSVYVYTIALLGFKITKKQMNNIRKIYEFQVFHSEHPKKDFCLKKGVSHAFS